MGHFIIKTSDEDNVGIVAGKAAHIPLGQKVALCNIDEGAGIIRYGQIIGHSKEAFSEGDWVKNSKISLPEASDLDAIPLGATVHSKMGPLEGYTFEGYRNPDGSVGTKNILCVATSVQCVAGLAQFVVKKIKEELLPAYPNVDDVVALNHAYGCGVAIDAPSAIIPIRTIRNIIKNPNFGGEVLLVGLGCEKLKPELLIPGIHEAQFLCLQDEALEGFGGMVAGIMKMAQARLKKLNSRKRELCPVSELVLGIQCGGSDVFSGLTANPVAGYVADLLVRAGGSVLFSEVTEVRDAVHLLVPRAIHASVGSALLDEMKWFDAYLKQGHVDRSANTSPGNKQGGLSNIVEKALGSIVKSGTSPIVDVLGPGEKVRMKGLTFAATPASDFVCASLQLAAGMNLHLFTSGRGTPYGLAEVPVVKVGSNTHLSKRWFDLIDFDAGRVISENRSIEEMGWELFHLILEVASGKRQVACDTLGLHNDLALFNPGPLT